MSSILFWLSHAWLLALETHRLEVKVVWSAFSLLIFSPLDSTILHWIRTGTCVSFAAFFFLPYLGECWCHKILKANYYLTAHMGKPTDRRFPKMVIALACFLSTLFSYHPSLLLTWQPASLPNGVPATCLTSDFYVLKLQWNCVLIHPHHIRSWFCLLLNLAPFSCPGLCLQFSSHPCWNKHM